MGWWNHHLGRVRVQYGCLGRWQWVQGMKGKWKAWCEDGRSGRVLVEREEERGLGSGSGLDWRICGKGSIRWL